MTPPEVWADRDTDSPPNSPAGGARGSEQISGVTLIMASGRPKHGSTNQPALGIHEVIIENPAHVANLAALDEAQFSKIFRAYRGRLRAVREDRRWRFALIFQKPRRARRRYTRTCACATARFAICSRRVVEGIGGAPRLLTSAQRQLLLLRADSNASSRHKCVWSRAVQHYRLCPVRRRVLPYETWILPRFMPAPSSRPMTRLSSLWRKSRCR